MNDIYVRFVSVTCMLIVRCTNVHRLLIYYLSYTIQSNGLLIQVNYV